MSQHKVSKVNNIHSYQKVETIQYSFRHPDILNLYSIG